MADNETIIFKILGVKDNEIVILESINDFTGCGEKSGQLHAITMRPITKEQIEYSWSEDGMEDWWKEAVQSGRTCSGLSDFIEEMKSEYDESLPFLDDNSFRARTEDALSKLPISQTTKIINLLEESCEINGDTYANIECSSMIHIDDDIEKEGKEFYNSFKYKTPYFKTVFPILQDFSNGKINYTECVEKLAQL